MRRIIAGIDIQPVDCYVGNPAGTPIARVMIKVSAGSFGGSLTISGTSKADFQSPVKNADGSFLLLSAIQIPAGWNPSINLIATDSHFANQLWAGPYVFSPTLVPMTLAVPEHVGLNRFYSPSIVARPPAAGPLSDAGFEVPVQTGGSLAYTYDPVGSPWIFAGNAGIQANGSGWGAPSAPEGTQTAFLQNQAGANGRFSQTFNDPGGTYVVQFKAVLRAFQVGTPGQSFTVSMDGAVIGSFAPTGIGAYATFTTSPVTLLPGSHTLTFAGTGPANVADSSVLIDAIALIAPPPITVTVEYVFAAPSFSVDTRSGASIATLRARRSDGQPWTGHFIFATGGDYGGAFAITMNPDYTGNLIVNPTGPGLGPLTLAQQITEHVFVEAMTP